MKATQVGIPFWVIACAGLFAGSVQAQTASDLDCAGCVQTNEIAVQAISSSRIKGQAVLRSKIQDNAVNDAKLSIGLRNRIVSLESGPAYFPYGPQVDVHPSRLNEWTQCYMDLYNNTGTALAAILSQCDGSKLVLACRPVGDTNFTLLAAGDRADVLTDTGDSANGVTTLGNGVEWYFNESHSWGFTGEGDSNSKNSCDTDNSGDADQRLCWHTGNFLINGGYRCGTTTGLNSNANWERHIYQID